MERVERRYCYDIGLSRCRSVYEIARSGISSRRARHAQPRCLRAVLSHMTCDRNRPGGVWPGGPERGLDRGVGDPVFAVSAALPVEKSYSTWAVLPVVYTNNTAKNFPPQSIMLLRCC